MTHWTEDQLAAYRSGQDMALPQPESEILAACLEYLQLHSAIAWAVRMNTGAWKTEEGRYVKFGFRGCSDIIGQMGDGKFLAFETKRPGKKPTDDQAAFLACVRAHHGLAGWGGLGELEQMLKGAT